MDARTLLRQFKQQTSSSSSSVTKSSSSPIVPSDQAIYDKKTGFYVCRTCDAVVKKAALWSVHVSTEKHCDAVKKLELQQQQQQQQQKQDQKEDQKQDQKPTAAVLPDDFFDQTTEEKVKSVDADYEAFQKLIKPDLEKADQVDVLDDHQSIWFAREEEDVRVQAELEDRVLALKRKREESKQSAQKRPDADQSSKLNFTTDKNGDNKSKQEKQEESSEDDDVDEWTEWQNKGLV